MGRMVVTISAAALALAAAGYSSLAQKLPPAHPPVERDGNARLSGLLAVGYGVVGGIGSLVMMERGTSVYLCQPKLDTTTPTTAEQLRVLAQQLQSAVCVAVVG
jgi:hypothetical protein